MRTVFRLIVWLLIASIAISISHAQQLEAISASGNYFANTNGSVSWTLGEGVIDTYSYEGNILTQGLHQTQVLITLINEPDGLQCDIKVYPNPPGEKLTIETSNSETLSYMLMDVNGKVLINEKIKDKKTVISMNAYANALYFLRVFENKKESRLFKVVKQ